MTFSERLYRLRLKLNNAAHRLGNIDGCDIEDLDEVMEGIAELEKDMKKEEKEL